MDWSYDILEKGILNSFITHIIEKLMWLGCDDDDKCKFASLDGTAFVPALDKLY